MKIEVFEINVFSLGKIKKQEKTFKKTCFFLHKKLFVFYDKKHQIDQPC